MKFVIEVEKDDQLGIEVRIDGPRLEYIENNMGHGINVTGLSETPEDEIVMEECYKIAKAIKNIIEIRGIREE